jgi:hypothetical protein
MRVKIDFYNDSGKETRKPIWVNAHFAFSQDHHNKQSLNFVISDLFKFRKNEEIAIDIPVGDFIRRYEEALASLNKRIEKHNKRVELLGLSKQ